MREFYDKLYKEKRGKFINFLFDSIEKEEKKFVITANPEIFMIGKKQKKVETLLLDKDSIVVPDGIGLILAGKKLGYHIPERIPGVEICEELLSYASLNRKKVFLFGAQPMVTRRLTDVVKSKYSGVKLCGVSHGYEENKESTFEKIKATQPDIILVALGMPQQEIEIYNHLSGFNKGIFIGVGGSFDVLSGMKQRAPAFWVKHNLEWLYRIMSEPQRIRRFWNNNIKFLIIVFKEQRKMGMKNDHNKKV